MTLLKLKIEIDLSKKDQLVAVNSLFLAIGSHKEATIEPMEEETTDTPKEEKPKRKSRAKKAAQTEEVKEDEASSDEKKILEFTEVRALFAKKLQQGDEKTRESCVSKLNELGVDKLPSLKEEDYQAFVDYLNTL